ncbi:MAG: hypothetical protein ACREPR_23690 [Brasilonema sp.]
MVSVVRTHQVSNMIGWGLGPQPIVDNARCGTVGKPAHGTGSRIEGGDLNPSTHHERPTEVHSDG